MLALNITSPLNDRSLISIKKEKKFDYVKCQSTYRYLVYAPICVLDS